MERRYKRTDDNQDEIVDGLKSIGCSVAKTTAAGGGFPDIVVGYRGVNWLIEIKDGNKIPSARKLTQDQVKFHAEWKGQIDVVNSLEDAIDLILSIDRITDGQPTIKFNIEDL